MYVVSAASPSKNPQLYSSANCPSPFVSSLQSRHFMPTAPRNSTHTTNSMPYITPRRDFTPIRRESDGDSRCFQTPSTQQHSSIPPACHVETPSVPTPTRLTPNERDTKRFTRSIQRPSPRKLDLNNVSIQE